MSTPEYIMIKLRQRLDLEPSDTSRDAEIEAMSPRRKFRECVAWELGDPGWADHFLLWLKDVGFEVREKDE